ncbi:MAG TPA: glycosyltransferase family 87 protein [Gemmataceae bacterium]|nr:glycosyltransferase family 87 protein [Gemmataceae bacterium]
MITAALSRLRWNWRQDWFLPLVALLLIALSVQYTWKAAHNKSAFVRWREQILQIDHGVKLYDYYHYPNPPIMALMLRPLAELPAVVGALIWFYLKVAMAAAAFWACMRMIEAGGAPFPTMAKAAALLLCASPLIGDLQHGNINILILFLVVTSLYSFHRGYDWPAGILLALAICCKATPALFVFYFLWKRQWKLLAGCLVGMALFLLFVPGIVLGWQENLALLESWYGQMIVPFLRDGIITSEHPNQSLPGVLCRLLTHSPSFCAYPNDVYTPSEYHNLLSLSMNQVHWLIRLMQGLFALLVIFLCRQPAKVRGGWRLCAEFGIICLGMLIFSERTWKHHSVVLLLPFAVLTYSLANQAWSRRKKAVVISLLGVVLALMLSASGIGSERAADLAQVYGVYLWAFLILLGLQAWMLWMERTRQARRLACRLGTTGLSAPSPTGPSPAGDSECGRGADWAGPARIR